MDFLSKLELLMAEKKLTRGGLAKQTGIPYTTIVGFYDKGYDNIKLSTLKRLAHFFNVSVDYLCNDNDDGEANPPIQKEYSLLPVELKLLVNNMIIQISQYHESVIREVQQK